MNKIEEAIENWWGPRCEYFNEYCPCCQAWVEYDQIKSDTTCIKRCTMCNNIIALYNCENNCCVWCSYDGE